jgi:hypothetical protein
MLLRASKISSQGPFRRRAHPRRRKAPSTFCAQFPALQTAHTILSQIKHSPCLNRTFGRLTHARKSCGDKGIGQAILGWRREAVGWSKRSTDCGVRTEASNREIDEICERKQMGMWGGFLTHAFPRAYCDQRPPPAAPRVMPHPPRSARRRKFDLVGWALAHEAHPKNHTQRPARPIAAPCQAPAPIDPPVGAVFKPAIPSPRAPNMNSKESYCHSGHRHSSGSANAVRQF